LVKMGALDTLPPVTGAAVVTSIVMYPADVIRAICMSNPGTSPPAALQGFLANHGLKGFVQQGLAAEITRASFSRMIKFWLQPIVHQAMYDKPETKGTPFSKGLCGALATFPEVVTISPLENVKLAEQLDTTKRFNGMASVCSHLMKTRGILGGFYCGYFGMQIRQCLWTGTFFLTLDVWKGLFKEKLGITGLAQDIFAGFGAGASGVLVNCWTDVVRSVVQKEAINATFDATIPHPGGFQLALNPAPFFAKMGEIHAAKGIGGLYAGVSVKCVHLGGSGAILAVLVPRFKTYWMGK
jgi:solute carrier family 25 2-oxodicarboxylate transporter 21